MSLALHIAVGAAALAPMGGLSDRAASAGVDVRGDMLVSLVSPPERLEAPASQESGSLQPLFAKLDTGAPPVTVGPKRASELSEVFERLTARSGPAQDLAAQPAEFADSGPTPSPARDGSDASPETRGGGLWGMVQPCWTRLAPEGPVNVTIDVALDARGAVSTRPEIIRAPDARIDEARLRAEARALSALSACLVRPDPRLGGRVYRLDFRPPPKPRP